MVGLPAARSTGMKYLALFSLACLDPVTIWQGLGQVRDPGSNASLRCTMHMAPVTCSQTGSDPRQQREHVPSSKAGVPSSRDLALNLIFVVFVFSPTCHRRADLAGHQQSTPPNPAAPALDTLQSLRSGSIVAMRQEFKFASGPGPPRAPLVSSSGWEQHRAAIDDLWMARAVPLKQLMDTMQSEHNFSHRKSILSPNKLLSLMTDDISTHRPKQYVQQLKKWNMHKSSPPRPSPNKRPHPSAFPYPGVGPDSLPSNSSPGAKRSRKNYTGPQHASHSGNLLPHPGGPQLREGPEVEVTSDSEASPDWEPQDGSDEDEDGPWDSEPQDDSSDDDEDGPCMCFCGKHADDIAKLSEALIQVSSSCDNSPATMGPIQMEDAIDRVEGAAEFVLNVDCERDAFQLYALFLKWALNHDGPICRCARDLVHRARAGCAISALDRSDLEVANALLEQTRCLSPLKDRQSLASWLFHESLVTWKLYNSRGLISIRGDSNWLVRLTNHLEATFEASLQDDTAVDWLTLAAMLCEELSPFVQDSDAAKGHLKDLQQGLQESLEGNAELSLDYSIRMVNSGAVRSCLQWMQDSPATFPLLPPLTRDKCHFRGQRVCSLHDINPNPRGPYPTTEFLAYWARLRRDLRDGSIPVWFEKLKASGIRPTEFLATVIRGQEFPFKDSGDNASSECSLRDEEITKEVRCCHVSFHMAFF